MEDALLISPNKAAENMHTVIDDYARAAKRKRGIKPYISMYCLNKNDLTYITSNGLARAFGAQCNARVLITVHYEPGLPGYNSALSHSIDDLYDGVWAAEALAFNELKRHEGSPIEVSKKKMLHPKKHIEERFRVSRTKFTNASRDDIFEYLVRIDDTMQRTNKNLISTNVNSSVIIGNEIFCDSIGSKIIQEISVFVARLEASHPTNDGFFRRFSMRDRLGAAGGTEILKKLEKPFARAAEDLSYKVALFAKAKDHANGFRFVPDPYNIVLDGRVAGVSIHELGAGHLAEATRLIYDGEEVSSPFLGKIGELNYLPELNIIDSGTLKVNGMKPVAFYKYDCEGTPAEETFLIREGRFNSYLHTRLSAGTLKKREGGRRLTGNARIQSVALTDEYGEEHTQRPEARMSNLMILPSKHSCSLDDLLHEVRGRGIFLSGLSFGEVNIEKSFGDVGFQEIYFVDESCNLIPIRVKDHYLFINDNVVSYMGKIRAVGDESTVVTDTGWCGADSGIVTHSANGAAILVENVAIEAQQVEKPMNRPLVPYNRRRK